MRKSLFGVFLIVVYLFICGTAEASGVKGIAHSKHNLSITGPGRIKITENMNQTVCGFCHTPHMAAQIQPLWQRTSKVIYTTYKSSTLKAAIGQPTGASRLCLSCHDGTIALGLFRGRYKKPVLFAGGVIKMPAGKTNLGVDLSDDHPISFIYDNNLASRNGQLQFPSALAGPVHLDKTDQLQCTSCHDAHNDQYGKFLVMDNRFSALCVTCHKINYWSLTSHKYSTATWNNVNPNPWPHTSYTTVAANGCENCHQPHTAGSRERLLHYEAEEDNCLNCHNGHVAFYNIKREFDKPSRHPIEKSRAVHNPDEDPLWASRHVECEDCHNPHATNATQANPPLASGKLAQLAGVSSSGTPVRPLSFEYELCYRCHADNPGNKTPIVTRQIFENNLRRKFKSSNASYHPVEAVGQNRQVPSLIIPYNTSSRIYCTDCHNSDSAGAGRTGPNGPHGSIWQPILAKQLLTTDATSESARAYALCYKCHNRNSILADQSFPEHRRHIVDQRAPCTACHDPHGVKENTHLINFDITIVFPNEQGIIKFEDNGLFSGTCSHKCHNRNHDREAYP